MSNSIPNIVVRPSTDEDVPAMLAIYSHHIQQGVGNLGAFEAEPLNASDLKQRRKNMRKRRLPHLVAEHDGTIAAYAYAVPFRKRPAYRFAVKHSIYVHPDFLHAGIGRVLLPALIDACAVAGYRQMVGYIDSANQPSLHLHEACGFRQVGRLPSVGFKFGHWIDSVLVQLALGPGGNEPPGAWLGSAPNGTSSDAAADTPRLSNLSD
jgi:phosphinothricin acetyltransferase